MTGPPDGRAKRRVLRRPIRLLLVGAVLAAIFWFAPKRPTYEGKTAEEWLLMLELDSGARADNFDAHEALIRIGAAALPELERILSRRPNKWRDGWNGWKARLRFAASPPLHEQQFRAIRATFILAESGNVDIRPLLPQLTFHARNAEQSEAFRALARAGEEGISVLTNLLFTGDVDVRRDASWGLHFVNKKSQATAALLRSATVETNFRARAEAFRALSSSGAQADQVVPLGLRLLGSEDGYTRRQAAEVLVDYRSLAEVSNALHAALSDPDVEVRRTAARAARR